MKRTLFIVALMYPDVARAQAGAGTSPPPAPAPLVAAPSDDARSPAPAAPVDASVLGVNIQRTMRLLATSTPRHRNRVRVLFYGQSITEQAWSARVADDLRRRFPDADLEIENRAIGGFASQLLERTAEHDLYPFYPDLVVLHVYGSSDAYERIVRSTRARTTAEVLIQTDHVATTWPDPTASMERDKSLWWDHLMNGTFLPATARKYDCGLVDVRAAWLDYLRANKLEPRTLLGDDVHLNARGNDLMAQLVSRHLVHRPDLPAPTSAVTDVPVDDPSRWPGGRFELAFDGNRVDAVCPTDAAPNPTAGAFDVLIDGRPPSSHPGCYYFTRPSPRPWSPLFIRRVGHDAPLVPERWTYTVRSVAADGRSWTFDVAGSVTGADGHGASDRPFRSTSGRVLIEPADHFRRFNAALPAGYEVTWSALPMFVDRYTEPPAATRAGSERSTTLAQGLPNGRHVLTLVQRPGEGTAPKVASLRIYRPPVAGG